MNAKFAEDFKIIKYIFSFHLIFCPIIVSYCGPVLKAKIDIILGGRFI